MTDDCGERNQRDDSSRRSLHGGFVGAMAGSGVAYSLVNGYGLLHGAGMGVAYLIIAVVLLALYHSAQRVRRWSNAG